MTFGGQSQPTIGTRTISSNIRLKDGETNFLAGLFRTDKAHGTTTIPFLGDIPLIGRLFSNKNTSTQTTDLVLTLTPHIMRIPDVTEEDLVPVYVGTDANISFQGTPRIESPTGQGPFDFRRETPPVRSTPAPNQPSLPAPQNLAPSGLPSDPFRSPRESVPPQPQPTPGPPRAEIAPQGASAVSTSASQTGLVFDFAPASIALAPGEQRSMLVRVTGEDGSASTSVTLRYDPAMVTVVAVRSILPDGGVADTKMEPGKVTLSSPNPVSISGTRAIAEVVLQGVKAGQSTLAFEPGGSSATFNQAIVEVR